MSRLIQPDYGRKKVRSKRSAKCTVELSGLDLALIAYLVDLETEYFDGLCRKCMEATQQLQVSEKLLNVVLLGGIHRYSESKRLLERLRDLVDTQNPGSALNLLIDHDTSPIELLQRMVISLSNKRLLSFENSDSSNSDQTEAFIALECYDDAAMIKTRSHTTHTPNVGVQQVITITSGSGSGSDSQFYAEESQRSSEEFASVSPEAWSDSDEPSSDASHIDETKSVDCVNAGNVMTAPRGLIQLRKYFEDIIFDIVRLCETIKVVRLFVCEPELAQAHNWQIWICLLQRLRRRQNVAVAIVGGMVSTYTAIHAQLQTWRDIALYYYKVADSEQAKGLYFESADAIMTTAKARNKQYQDCAAILRNEMHQQAFRHHWENGSQKLRMWFYDMAHGCTLRKLGFLPPPGIPLHSNMYQLHMMLRRLDRACQTPKAQTEAISLAGLLVVIRSASSPTNSLLQGHDCECSYCTVQMILVLLYTLMRTGLYRLQIKKRSIKSSDTLHNMLAKLAQVSLAC